MDCKKLVAERIERLKRKMEDAGIDMVLLQKPEHVFYFSNFNPVLNSHPALLIIEARQQPCLLVHAIRYEHAKEESMVDQIELYGKWGAASTLAMRPEDGIAMIVGQRGRIIGLETDYMSMDFHQELIKRLKPKRVSSVSHMVNMLKIIKDPWEIEKIRCAARLVDTGVAATIEALSMGATEAKASTEGQYAMRQQWHKDFASYEVSGFGTSEGGMIDSLHVWCLSNGHIAYGCDCPRNYRPKPGDLTLPMAWAKVGGCHAENERTIIIGHLSAFQQNAYDSMLRARERIFQLLRPGVLFEQLYMAAAQVYADSGFQAVLPGRVGHGVGCSAHEFPSLEKGNKIPLAAGMVFTVEPGLMDQSWGGVRHSDTVLITEKGYEILTTYERGEIVIQTPN